MSFDFLTNFRWMSSVADDVRLPFSTLDPIVGDVISLLWEPETLRSMGNTMNLLATEVLFLPKCFNLDPYAIITTNPWSDCSRSSYEFYSGAYPVDKIILLNRQSMVNIPRSCLDVWIGE
jgi:hypothetical protein